MTSTTTDFPCCDPKPATPPCCDPKPATPRRYALDATAARAYFDALVDFTESDDPDAPHPGDAPDAPDAFGEVDELREDWTNDDPDNDQHAVTKIVDAAWSAGWLTGPSSPDLLLDQGDNHYAWRTHVPSPAADSTGLWLTSHYEGWSSMRMAAESVDATGAALAVAVLHDVVLSLNPQLDDLDAMITAYGGTVPPVASPKHVVREAPAETLARLDAILAADQSAADDLEALIASGQDTESDHRRRDENRADLVDHLTDAVEALRLALRPAGE